MRSVFPSSFIEYPLHRTTDWLISAMNAAYPAARSAYSFLKLRDDPIDMLLPLRGCFNRDSPADPFIAGERRNVLPCGQSLLISGERFSQISRQGMHDTTRNLLCHTLRLSQESQIKRGTYEYDAYIRQKPFPGVSRAPKEQQVDTDDNDHHRHDVGGKQDRLCHVLMIHHLSWRGIPLGHLPCHWLAGPPGIEPGLAVLETAVLPLNYGPEVRQKMPQHF